MVILVTIFVILVVVIFLFMQQSLFGQNPHGEKLKTIQQESNYHDGKFQNIQTTPQLTEGFSYFEILQKFLFQNTPRRTPLDMIPSVKTDLLHLPIEQDVLIWFGHSSYYIQIDGKRILVDPVFSGNASPIPNTVKSFKGTDIYTTDDMPEIDYLFISHDHYDHIDYETLISLKGKIKKVICGLGVGSHFEHWGYASEMIIEKNWHESVDLGHGFIAHIEPARHFSGRGLLRNKTLWASYVLQTPTMKIYIGGDSGYGTHYAEIGKKHHAIDLAILENGQYDEAWKYIHNQPAEVLQAAKDLHATRVFPVHSSKFVLANHAWDEPLVKITELNKEYNLPLVTPKIGEVVYLKDSTQQFSQWWVGIQ